jgi:hypothetical protein
VTVAAATDVVGAAEAGGAWHLQVRNDANNAASPLTAATMATYRGVLASRDAMTISVVTDDVLPVTGTLSSGARTNDPNLTIRLDFPSTGTAVQVGDTIKLFTNGSTQLGSTYTITAGDLAATFALVATGPLTDGVSYAITAIWSHSNSDSDVSAVFNVTEDRTAPTAVATVTALSADNGGSGTDFITNVASQTVSGTFSGTLGSGETIQVSADGGSNWINATAGAGTWSAGGVTLIAGGTSLSVRTTDTAGNVTAGTAHGYTLDTAAPTAVATVTALSADSGNSSTDFITSVASQTVSGTFSGTLGGGETIQVSANGGGTWINATAGAGAWSASGVSLTAGGTSLSVRTIDTAGNVVAGIAHGYTLDVTAPTAVATVTALSADNGSSGTDFVTNVASQTVSGTFGGTLGGGETIQVSANGGSTWVNATAGAGTWSAGGVTLTAGGTSLSVRTIDTAGNVVAGTAHGYTLDTTVPATPGVALTNDTGVAGDGISNVGTLNVTGLEAGTTVQYSIDSGTTWTSSFAAAEGANSVRVRQTDVAGNQSAAGSLSFTLDTHAPATPLVALAIDSGVAGDGVTKDGTLNVTGLEAGATVQYSIDSGAHWTSSFTALEGLNAVQVRQGDAAGNQSAAASLSFTLDSAAAAPLVALVTDSGIAGDGISNNGALNVTGLETGATVQYSTDNGANWTSSFTAIEGLNAVRVRQTDIAGNQSPSASLNFTLDSAAAAPVVALATDSGVAGDGISNVGTLNLTGLETGATVQYSVDNGTTWTSGFTAAEGSNSVRVRQIDVAGNQSAAGSLSFTLDTLAPAAPLVALAADSGVAGDGVTKDGTLNVSGLEAGATVQYSIDSGAHWTSSFTAVEGLNAVQVRQGDAAGNLSAAASLSFTLDSSAAAPLVALLTDSGVAGDGISNVGTLSVTGLETGATVEYSIDSGAQWASSFTATEGANIVQVRQTDVAGNQSASANLSFTFDSTAAAPSLALVTDSGVAGDGISNVGTVNVTGLETGATVQYSVDNGATWTSSFTAAEGANTVQSHQTDIAGNISLASAALTFTLDTLAPAAPLVALATDSGVAGDGITKDGTLNVTGLEAGATVQYSIDSGAHWTSSFTAVEGLNAVQVRQGDAAGNQSAAASLSFTLDSSAAAPLVALATDSGIAGDGISNNGALNVTGLETGATVQYSTDNGANWTSSFTAIEGSNAVRVRQTDIAGNQSPSASLSFTLDSTVAAPALALTTDSGVAGDGISNVGTLNVTGLETGATVQYSVDNGTTWTSGFTAAEGSNTIQTRQTDVAGNISLASAALTFTLDTLAPAAPLVALATDSGLAGDGITKDGTLNVTGLEAGATVQYSIDSGAHWTSSFTAVEGLNAVQVRQGDAAGNQSAPASLSFTLDSSAAAPLVALTTDSGIAGDGISNVGTLNVTGLETGATVEYSIDSGAHWASSFTATEGANIVQVRQTDIAGNQSPSASLSFTLDSTVAAPLVALTTDSGVAGDGISNVGTLNVTGLETGATVQYSVDNGTTWTSGFTAVEGANTVQSHQTDIAGNISLASAALTFTLDTLAPAAPLVALATDSGLAGDGITKDGTLNVTGLEAGATVQYSIDSGAHWTSSFAAVQGSNAVQVRQTDVAGNQSTSASVSFTLDSAAAAPLVALLTDSGVAGDGISNVGTLSVTGLESGATVEYSIDSGAHWASSFTAVEGSNAVQVRQTDIAGNQSPSASLSFTLDSTVAAPALALTTDSGVAGDGISNVGTLNVTGLETGATVQYSVDNGTTWTSGFTAVEGANTVQSHQTDIAGNISLASAALTFTLDTLAPAAPLVALATDSGLAGDGITKNGTLNVTGLEAGATVQYSIDSGAHWTSSFAAVEGSNAVQVRQTDVAGNQSVSASLTFVLDSAAAAPLVALLTDSGVAGDGISNVGTLNVTGLETGATVEYSIDSGAHWASSFTAVEGSNAVQVRQTDIAGNQSPSASLSFTLDSTVAAPALALTIGLGRRR